MPLQKRYMAVPGVLTTRDFSGSMSYATTASQHILYEQSVGYTGKIPKERPKPVHPFSTYNDSVALQSRDFRQYADGRWRLISGSRLSATTPHSPEWSPLPDFGNVYNQAVSGLNEKTRGELDLSVDLAEAHKTKQMFDATKRVEDYTRVFTKRFRTLKLIGNHWLEFTYGLKPLMSSVYGIAEENIRIVVNKSQRFRARAVDYSWRPKTVTLITYYGRETFPVVSGNFKLSCTLGVDLSEQMFDPSRWSSLNPISIAWELMPYSFVVDWFYNVGGYVRGVETAVLYGGRFRSGYRTDLLAYSGTSRDTFDYTKAGYNPGGWYESNGVFKGSSITRTLLNTYPFPERPRLQANLGSSRLFSAAALLTQFLGRR